MYILWLFSKLLLQISATAAKGEILPLDKHLDEYTQQHNTLLVDSFLKVGPQNL